jgi:hypothetical protein
MDTHALSEPAFASALEVLAANGVEVMVDADEGYTHTPVISHAILTYNRGRKWPRVFVAVSISAEFRKRPSRWSTESLPSRRSGERQKNAMPQQTHSIWLKADVDGFDTLVD